MNTLETELESMHQSAKFKKEIIEETKEALIKVQNVVAEGKKREAGHALENDETQIGPNKRR